MTFPHPIFCPSALADVVADYTDGASSTSNTSTYNFAGLAFTGATASDYIVVGIASRSTTTSRTINSVTVDGEAASVVTDGVTNAFTVHSASSGGSYSAIYIAPATGNASGTVSVAWNNTMVRCGVFIWVVKNLLSTTAVDVASDTSTAPSMSLDISDGGVVFMTSFGDYTSWSGVTEDATFAPEGWDMDGGHDEYATGATGATISASGGSSTSNVTLVSLR